METIWNTPAIWWIGLAILAFITGIIACTICKRTVNENVFMFSGIVVIICIIIFIQSIWQSAIAPNYNILPPAWRDLAKSSYKDPARQKFNIDAFINNSEAIPRITLVQYKEVVLCISDSNALSTLDAFVQEHDLIGPVHVSDAPVDTIENTKK